MRAIDVRQMRLLVQELFEEATDDACVLVDAALLMHDVLSSLDATDMEKRKILGHKLSEYITRKTSFGHVSMPVNMPPKIEVNHEE